MRKKTYKTQADLFSFVLDEFVEDEETCISEFCFKNKSQAYENLKIKRNHLAEEWNRLTEEREQQIRNDAIDNLKNIFNEDYFNIFAWSDGTMNFNNCSLMIRDMLEQLKGE